MSPPIVRKTIHEPQSPTSRGPEGNRTTGTRSRSQPKVDLLSDTVVLADQASAHTRHDVQQGGAQPWTRGLAVTVGSFGTASPDTEYELPPENKPPTHREHGPGWRDLGPCVRQLAEALVQGGTLLEQEGAQAGTTIRQVGDALKLAPNTVGEAHHRAHGLSQEAHPGAETTHRGLVTTRNAVDGFTQDAARIIRPATNVASLSVGSCFSVVVDGAVDAATGRTNPRGKVQVFRLPDGPFRVRVEGGIAPDLFSAIGVTVGFVDVGVGGKALLGAIGQVELTCAAADDASRAMHIILGHAAVGASRPSTLDYGFLALHLSSVELHGEAATTVTGILGWTRGPPQLSPLFPDCTTRTADCVRLEFETGAPMQLAVCTMEGVDLTTRMGLNSADGSAGGRGALRLRQETRFTFSSSVAPSQLLANPPSTISQALKDLLNTRAFHTTCRLRSSTSTVGAWSGGCRLLGLNSSPGELLSSGALSRVFQGDGKGAVALLRPGSNAFYSFASLDTFVLGLNPLIARAGLAVQLDGKTMRTDIRQVEGDPRGTQDPGWMDDDPEFDPER